jgi:excisionase family DNA binding protein
MADELLTVKEAAARLRVSSAMIYDLAARRDIRSCRIGAGRGVIRVPASALAEYLERVMTRPTMAPPKTADQWPDRLRF